MEVTGATGEPANTTTATANSEQAPAAPPQNQNQNHRLTPNVQAVRKMKVVRVEKRHITKAEIRGA